MNLSSVSSSQLEYLVAALSHKTWREAAASVGVSASALSQGIAELERRLGLVLFTRTGRQRVPTAESERVRHHGERVLAELRELARWADEVRSGATGEVSIGMIDTAAIHHFGDALVGFRRSHPDLTVRLFVRPSKELLDLLRSGEVDAAVVVDPDQADDMDLSPLIDEPLYIYAPPDAVVGPATTWGPWVGFPATSRTRSAIARSLRARGVTYDVVAESSQPAVLREMVHLGMGWCVLAATDAESEPHSLTRAVAEPLTSRSLTLVTRSGPGRSIALSKLLAALDPNP